MNIFSREIMNDENYTFCFRTADVGCGQLGILGKIR